MNGDIKFSIMTPVYKVEKYLDECVMSVLGQSYENFELILVDDGSPDRCGEMCDAWAQKDCRVKAFHKPNGGLVSARSFALEHVSGDYYVFLDSDDYILPNALETLYSKINETHCDCIVYSSVKKNGDQVIESAVCSEKICGRLITDKREALSTILCCGSYNAIWRKCVRAECFDGRDYTPVNHLKHGEDLVRTLEILENAESYLFISDVLHVYRYNPESMTQTINYDGRTLDFSVEKLVDKTVEKVGVFTEDEYNRLRNMRLDYLAIQLRARARFCSTRETAIETMKKIRDNEYVADMLEKGYRKTEAVGEYNTGRLQGLLYRMNISLFRQRRYKMFILLDSLMVKLLDR